jgi:hypothetical protein
METIEKQTTLESNFRYSVIEVLTDRKIFRVSKPRKNSIYWTNAYVVWDNLLDRKVRP